MSETSGIDATNRTSQNRNYTIKTWLITRSVGFCNGIFCLIIHMLSTLQILVSSFLVYLTGGHSPKYPSGGKAKQDQSNAL